MDEHGPHMGAHGSHMDEHGPHVNWKIFKKKILTKCPMGINKGTIPHLFQFVQHQFWVHMFVLILLCYCHVLE